MKLLIVVFLAFLFLLTACSNEKKEIVKPEVSLEEVTPLTVILEGRIISCQISQPPTFPIFLKLESRTPCERDTTIFTDQNGNYIFLFSTGCIFPPFVEIYVESGDSWKGIACGELNIDFRLQ